MEEFPIVQVDQQQPFVKIMDQTNVFVKQDITIVELLHAQPAIILAKNAPSIRL